MIVITAANFLRVNKMAILFDLNDKYNVVNYLFDKLPYLYWKDVEGIYRGANHNQIRLLGLAQMSDFVGRNIFEILSDRESAQRIHDGDNMIMSEASPRIIEETIRFADGEIKSYLSYKVPLLNHKHSVSGLLGFSLNITQYHSERRKMLAEHLEEIFTLKKSQWVLEKFQQLSMSPSATNFNGDNADKRAALLLRSKNLTTRQEEILFLLLVGRTTKQMIEIFFKIVNIKISAATINSIIKNELLPLFQVSSVAELLELVRQLDIIKAPPKTLCCKD